MADILSPYQAEIVDLMFEARPTEPWEVAEAKMERALRQHVVMGSNQLRASVMGMGADVVSMLNSARVPRLPVLEGNRTNYTQHGHGWHVYSLTQEEGTNLEPFTHNVGVTSKGLPFGFQALIATTKGTEGVGMLDPWQFGDERMKRILMSPTFMEGVASLIAGHGPLHAHPYNQG